MSSKPPPPPEEPAADDERFPLKMPPERLARFGDTGEWLLFHAEPVPLPAKPPT